MCCLFIILLWLASINCVAIALAVKQFLIDRWISLTESWTELSPCMLRNERQDRHWWICTKGNVGWEEQKTSLTLPQRGGKPMPVDHCPMRYTNRPQSTHPTSIFLCRCSCESMYMFSLCLWMLSPPMTRTHKDRKMNMKRCLLFSY